MANLNVTYEQMQAQATKFNAAKSEIEDKLAALRNEVQSLVSGGFVTDSASGQFEHSYEQFNNGAKEAIGGLEGMAMYLNKAAAAFQDVDQELAKALQ